MTLCVLCLFFTTIQGSCVNAGYTQCCEDEADCVGSLPGCFCDVSCHLRGDCCHDIHDTCSETPPPPLGEFYSSTGQADLSDRNS